jgi:hypothetical protein
VASHPRTPTTSHSPLENLRSRKEDQCCPYAPSTCGIRGRLCTVHAYQGVSQPPALLNVPALFNTDITNTRGARASHRGDPGSSPGLVMWDLRWTKWHLGRFSPSTSVSHANLHSTNCSTVTLIYHLGLYNRPVVAAVPSGLSLTPLRIIIKRKSVDIATVCCLDCRGISIRFPAGA